MTRVPAELVTPILEEVYYDYYGFPNKRTLRACALVCSVWSGPAQRLLFHNLRVPGSPERLKTFRATLYATSERAQILASFVRRAEIDITTDAETRDLVELLYHCPHLYELRLRVGGIHEFNDATMTALSDAQITERATPIRALALLSCGIQSPIIYQLMEAWPTVRFLRLGTELAAPPPPAMSTGARLYELVLQRTPCVEGLEWLLSASQKSLHILECNMPPAARHNQILARYTEHLQSLRLIHHTPFSAALIRQCTNLREVMFAHLSDFLSLGELPQTLEHITFRYVPGVVAVVPPSIVTAVDKLPRLRLVSCHTSARQAVDYPALQEKCKERHVELGHDVVPIRTVSFLRHVGYV
jgi:hypothetical protein